MNQVTVLTWNVQGSGGLDLDLAVATIERVAPDVVVLQEIQRGQCRRLARRLGWSARWAFKHWPVRSRAEGMAVLTPHRLGRVARFVVHGSWWWSWQRRIALDATVLVDARPWRVMNVHLSPHELADRRHAEMTKVLERSSMVAPVIVGDLNERPGGPVRSTLAGRGWVDAWAVAHPQPVEGTDAGTDAGATNWTEGDRGGRPPTQRLDVIYAPERCSIARADVVDQPLDRLTAASDHLPLAATIVRSDP